MISPETRKRQSKASKGRRPWNKGKTTSPETRAKLSAAAAKWLVNPANAD